jgi:hypothetical protein
MIHCPWVILCKHPTLWNVFRIFQPISWSDVYSSIQTESVVVYTPGFDQLHSLAAFRLRKVGTHCYVSLIAGLDAVEEEVTWLCRKWGLTSSFQPVDQSLYRLRLPISLLCIVPFLTLKQSSPFDSQFTVWPAGTIPFLCWVHSPYKNHCTNTSAFPVYCFGIMIIVLWHVLKVSGYNAGVLVQMIYWLEVRVFKDRLCILLG